MHFSITCGLFLCVTTLSFLPAQGQLDPDSGPVRPACCVKLRRSPFDAPVSACFVQTVGYYPYCRISAIISQRHSVSLRARMHFSITCGLFLCVTMLFFLPVQGKHVLKKGPLPKCCTKVSGAPILQPVKECYEQLANKIPYCKVHAYMFITDKNEEYCVDPRASWVKDRLKKLEKVSYTVKILRPDFSNADEDDASWHASTLAKKS
ncbi:hypothetical protein GBF38_011546 [Nibea albiflora]|uniref:Uncharacterized protein n=1 Tax=Nibea albiflora TaxID=240163 RepID=A0ACB7F7F1_NIBAL|nr:hypothetical protein GBF38_011546 [Nibea albiflora]